VSAPSLIHIVTWAQSLAAEVLLPGALAVDLTAGSGRDTLFLWQQVAPGGQVISFDIQPAALAETSSRLQLAGVPLWQFPEDGHRVGADPGVYLAAACHSRLGEFVDAAPKAILANLGFHPGGDREVITRPETTLAALRAAAGLLAPGGRLVVTVYPGHPGGAAEAAAVADWFAALTPRYWEALLLRVANREQAPFLLLAEKRDAASPVATA
jgi:SAM-dependent methyltransferase